MEPEFFYLTLPLNRVEMDARITRLPSIRFSNAISKCLLFFFGVFFLSLRFFANFRDVASSPFIMFIIKPLPPPFLLPFFADEIATIYYHR